ncbi:MAG TPA: hypothetical protein VFP95_06485 [Gammaproteobacteria bacterium]|nr:hypothetical protein [Gammaproteobacteria bacterium]
MQLEQIEKQTHALEEQATATLAQAKDFTITTEQHYQTAGDQLKAIKARARELDSQEKSITKPINDSLRQIRDLFRRPKDVLANAERTLKQAMTSYFQVQERKRLEEQRKVEDAARKERERLARCAEKAEQRGDEQKAEQFEERATQVQAPVIAQQKPKVSGVSVREIWKYEIVDKMELIKAVAEGKASPDLLSVNGAEIGRRVRALKGEFNVPGVRAFAEKTMAA